MYYPLISRTDRKQRTRRADSHGWSGLDANHTPFELDNRLRRYRLRRALRPCRTVRLQTRNRWFIHWNGIEPALYFRPGARIEAGANAAGEHQISVLDIRQSTLPDRRNCCRVRSR